MKSTFAVDVDKVKETLHEREQARGRERVERNQRLKTEAREAQLLLDEQIMKLKEKRIREQRIEREAST